MPPARRPSSARSPAMAISCSSKRPAASVSIASSRLWKRSASVLYYLLYQFRGTISGFNVFHYITFRTAWAALTALLLSFVLGPKLIERMTRIKLGQFIREEGPKSHQQKAGTPTMGGILINLAILIPTILWADIL